MTRVKTSDARNALGAAVRKQVKDAAGDDGKLTRREQAALPEFAQKAAESVRKQHPGKSPAVNDVVDATMTSAMRGWNEFNPQNGSRDAQTLSAAEVNQIARKNPSLGVATRAAVEIAQKSTAAPLSQAQALGKAREGLTAYIQDTRMKDPDWTAYFPSSWPELVARGVPAEIAKFGDPASGDVEVMDKPDRFIFTGRGPLQLYTEMEVRKTDGKILRALIEID